MRITAIVAALFLSSSLLGMDAPQANGGVGDLYEITRVSDSVDQSSDQSSSGTSHDADSVTERVVAIRDGGLELEYDLLKPTAEERAAQWKFPARIFKLPGGLAQLLNQAELASRVDHRLKASKFARTACGKWLFTWNAFRIECDPRSVLRTLDAFDLGPDLLDGALYRNLEALGAAPLKRVMAPDGATFTVDLKVDPDVARKKQAEADVVVAEIMRKPLTPEAALRAHADETISGMITIRFETDSAGRSRRRTTITRLTTKQPDGVTEVRTTTETLSRRLIVPNAI